MNTDWDNIADSCIILEELIKKDKKKIKKIKKRIKKNREKIEELKEIYFTSDGLLSHKNRSKTASYIELTEWNPISEANEITLTGMMVCCIKDLKYSNEKPNKPYYKCIVIVNYPNGASEKIDGYIWLSTTQSHKYLIELGATIGLLIQIIDENEIYAKVVPQNWFDVSTLVDEDVLKKLNENNDSIPLEHQNKWWNRIIVE